MLFLRALAAWFVLIAVETANGVFRKLVLEPLVGDLTARQISVFTGSVLILIATFLFIDRIRAKTTRQLALVGIIWVGLTVAFEAGMGRFILDYSWERILSDFDLAEGGLLGIGLLLMGLAPAVAVSLRRVRATRAERDCPFPGDDRIPKPVGSVTHAVTIRCSLEELWPWLAQMGAGRAGWYSYDLLDNGGQRSAECILPELQSISVGTLFPALPGAADGFFVLMCEPLRFLVLGASPRNGVHAATWAFVVKELEPNEVRLIARVRVNAGYRLHGLPLGLVKLVHYIMQRKQLLEITRRAEMMSSQATDWSLAS